MVPNCCRSRITHTVAWASEEAARDRDIVIDYFLLGVAHSCSKLSERWFGFAITKINVALLKHNSPCGVV